MVVSPGDFKIKEAMFEVKFRSRGQPYSPTEVGGGPCSDSAAVAYLYSHVKFLLQSGCFLLRFEKRN
jgi:hypothetical protein